MAVASRTSVRRRHQSRFETASVALLAAATLLVLAVLPARSTLWLSIASAAALASAWGSLRLMWAVVLRIRRENASDRAAAATAYRNLFSQRALEHAEFITAMTERLAEAHLSQRELEGLVTQHETHAQRAESGLAAAKVRIEALEEALVVLGVSPSDAVADLVAWDEQAGRRTRKRAAKDASTLKQA